MEITGAFDGVGTNGLTDYKSYMLPTALHRPFLIKDTNNSLYIYVLTKDMLTRA
mgnify:FL=1